MTARRKLIGNIFTVTALSQGGLWWAAVTISATITLWGIGTKSDHKDAL